MGCNNSPAPKKQTLEENTIRIKPTPKEEEKSKALEIKIVLLGNLNVGKTSIASRYCKNSFNEHHINTIGGAYQQQNVILNNGVNETFNLSLSSETKIIVLDVESFSI